MKWYVIQNTQLSYQDDNGKIHILPRGWGNGYVAVPPNHPAYKMDYDTLIFPLEVHGGLTYSNFGDGVTAPKEWWVFGFDTSHWDDNLEKWGKKAVEAETKRLFCQLLDIELGGL